MRSFASTRFTFTPRRGTHVTLPGSSVMTSVNFVQPFSRLRNFQTPAH